MRQPTEDLNDGAVLARQPAMVQAARTAAIATESKNKEQGKLQTINKLGSALHSAISPYLEEEAKLENEARFQKAYLEPGTTAGREQFLRDNRRTKMTAVVFGGQTPEYQGVLAASADATANELYAEQSNFIESEQGDMSTEDYYKHSGQVAKKFMEDNFTETPDAAVAFMKSWQSRSVTLATQHSKLQAVRNQQKARQGFKNQFQSALTASKTLAPHDSEGAHVILSDMYDYSKVNTNMARPAWSSAVVEETIAVMSLGDTSVIETFQSSDTYRSLDAKQQKAYTTAMSKLDTGNVNRVSNYNDALELSLMAAQTQSQIDRAFETHATDILTLSARNTLTAKHMATVSGGNVFRGKMAETYDAKRKTERAERDKLLATEAANAEAQYLYEQSTIQGNEGNEISARISKSSAFVVSSINSANNVDLPLSVRNTYIGYATVAQENLEKEGANTEQALSSKANLIQSKLSYLMAEAAAKGTLPNIPKELVQALHSIESISKADNTKTLVNNLLAGISKASDTAGEEYIKGVNQAEVDGFVEGDNENQIGLKTVESDPDIQPELRSGVAAQYIENIIGNIQKQRESNNLTKDGAKTLQEQELSWKTKLASYASEEDRLATKKAVAEKKVNDDNDIVAGVRKSWEDSTSISIDANPEHVERASNELLVDILRTPENEDLSDVDLIDAATSDRASILKLQYKLDNIDESFKSTKLKAAMGATLRRMTSELPPNTEGAIKWSEENTKAVEAMQTAYAEGSVLWNQLDTDEQQKSIYLMHAINSNMDRASTMAMANKPEQEGSGPKAKDKYWKGIVQALELDKANDMLQAQAESMYTYLSPKIGHDAAVEHTTKLTKHANIENKVLSIKFGKQFPPIPVTIMKDGKPAESSVTLENLSKGFMTYTPEVKTYGVTGVKRVDTTSTGSILLQQLIGNNKRKDGTAITSFTEVPGFSAEVVGDNVVFHSNYGSTELNITKLGSLAKDLEAGKKRHDKRRKEQQRTYSMGTRGLFN